MLGFDIFYKLYLSLAVFLLEARSVTLESAYMCEINVRLFFLGENNEESYYSLF